MRCVRMTLLTLILFTLVAAAQQADTSHLPVGDGKISAVPRVGYVFSCQTEFHGGGAQRTGDWVHADGTFDPAAKPVVQGKVEWPDHAFTLALAGETRNVTGNDLPDHATGTFPISASDPAAQYDRNPNSIAAQPLLYKLPANPVAAAAPACVGMGPIGFLLTGVYLFNALDAQGRDAVAHEIQDLCHGHPERRGAYHYHSLTNCLDDPGTGHSRLVGYAVDGFGIYGMRGEDGKVLHDADLDACHGHTHAIQWDGRTVVMYHYHATAEYPYVIGCFHGTPAVQHHEGTPGGGGERRGPGMGAGRGLPGGPPS
jgi:hypothetical protein